MLFNSPIYIFAFLPVVALVYFRLNSRNRFNAGKVWLMLASLFFYGYWKPIYLILIISSMLTNFMLGTVLHRLKQELLKLPSWLSLKSVLVTGIVFNLGLLGYFKYVNFFLENLNWFTGANVSLLELSLPLAISFFTFQQVAYLVDCYQQDTQEYDFLSYSLFVSFFPQLIAGPIVHHYQMLPQFMQLQNKAVNWHNIFAGVIIFNVGLFKKVAIADTFAVWANAGFDSSAALGFLSAWGASLSYTFQLYYDFSGYSDMAIGAALIFNIHLPVNFNSPYKATSIQDFWRRWHMTLSQWLRDYIYIPLGGNRSGQARTYINLFITFLLGGLWHGAGWTFVIWGAMHGTALALHRFWSESGHRMPPLLGWFCTFFFINITWVFFRAEDFDSALQILRSMFVVSQLSFSLAFVDQLSAATGVNLHHYLSLNPATSIVSEISLLAALVALLAVLKGRNMMEKKQELILLEKFSVLQLCLYSLLCVTSLLFLLASTSEVFLYFNF